MQFLTQLYLHTPTYTHTWKHTHCSYTIFLPPPKNSMHWILVILTTWWNSTASYEDQHSPDNSTTYQHAPCHAGYLRISVYLLNGSLVWSSNIFLNDLCHYMVFSISEFPVNIYILITHGLVQASNALLTYGLSPQVLLFQSCSNTMYMNHSYTWTLFFPIYGSEF